MNSEKECVPNANISKCAVVLLDVAGTTTSLAFVKDTLFTFATDNAPSFLKDNWEDEEIKKAVKLLQDGDVEIDVDGAIEVFKKLSGENSDNKGLKILQGLIYKKGYADNKLKAHVFADVPKTFENWSKERKVAIYSTGSVESQKLLFTHSTEGDLSQHISYYFDQSVGPKTDSESYKKIAAELKVKEEEILFINDNVDELKAAKEAGLLPVLVKREGNEEVSEDASKNFTIISSFADLPLDNPNKRKKEDEIDATEAPPTKIAKTAEEDKSASSTAGSSAEVVSEKPEVAEEKPDDQKKVNEEKVEAAEKKPELSEEKEKTKEQPVEKPKAETEIELMEVDVSEVEEKTDSTTENDATNAAPKKEEVNKEINVAEAMETEQLKETAVAEVKTVVEPVENSKTDTEKLAEKANNEATEKPKNPEETMETDHKTEDKKEVEVEVACNAESVDVKKNGVEKVEIEVLKKETEKVEVAEEAKEITKDNGKNDEDNTDKVKETTESNKDESKVAEDAAETKTKKDTEKEESKEATEAVKDEKVVKETIEKKEHTETDTKVIESKEQKPTEAEKPVEETIAASTTTKECSEEKTNEAKEKCPVETKDLCPEKEETTAKEEISENNKDKKETEAADKVEESKNNEKTVSETVAKELKDNIEETVKAQENTSENKIGNGSCDLNATENVAKNGEIVNGQENGDKKNDETDPEETDIKIKKLETNTGSPAVSVEV